MKVKSEIVEIYANAYEDCKETADKLDPPVIAGLNAVMGYLDSFEKPEKPLDVRVPEHWLTHIMDEYGLSQSKLARKIDTCPTYLSKIIRGKINMTVDMEQRIFAVADDLEAERDARKQEK